MLADMLLNRLLQLVSAFYREPCLREELRLIAFHAKDEQVFRQFLARYHSGDRHFHSPISSPVMP